jgi:hypothetical protein
MDDTTTHVVADEFDPFQIIGEASDVIRPLGSFERLFWLNGLHRPPHFAVTAQIAGKVSAGWSGLSGRLSNRKITGLRFLRLFAG